MTAIQRMGLIIMLFGMTAAIKESITPNDLVSIVASITMIIGAMLIVLGE